MPDIGPQMFYLDMHTHGQQDRCSHTTILRLLQRVVQLRQGVQMENIPGLAKRCSPSALKRGFPLNGLIIVRHGFAPVFTREEKEFAAENRILLLPGIEAYTNDGELLVYGIDQQTWEKIFARAQFRPQEIIDAVDEYGGVCAPAHPFRQLYPYVWNLNRPGIVVIEEINGGNLDRVNEIAREMVASDAPFAGIGGSDAHHTDWLGQCLTCFAQPITDVASLVSTLKKGKQGGYRAAYLYELINGEHRW